MASIPSLARPYEAHNKVNVVVAVAVVAAAAGVDATIVDFKYVTISVVLVVTTGDERRLATGAKFSAEPRKPMRVCNSALISPIVRYIPGKEDQHDILCADYFFQNILLSDLPPK